MSLQYRYLGNTGLKVSNICLGTMTFGMKNTMRPGQCNEEESHKLLDKFVECGGNFIDTANFYQDGNSEEIVGSWLQRQERHKMVVATKVRFTMNPSVNEEGLSRTHILWSVEKSLERLRTDYIDLYQIHCWDCGTPIEETLRTLNDLVRVGKVRYIGASNLTGWQLQKMLDYSKFLGLERFVSLQAQYSLLSRESEFELVDLCREEKVGFLPWSPLKGGWLSGKMQRGMSGAPEGSRIEWATKSGTISYSHPEWDTFAGSEKTWKLLDAMNDIAQSHKKTVAQVAINWLLKDPLISSVVIGAKTMAQLEDNMSAGTGWTISDEEVAAIMSLQYRYLGNTGLKVSNICLGTMTFGTKDTNIRPGQCSEELSHKLLDKFVECGGNFIDTANVYQDGNSEEIVGSWLQRQERQKMVVATKVRFTMDPGPNGVGLSRSHILWSVEESLKRLRTDYIDLYQIHCWDSGTPIEETLCTLNDLVRQGKVRYIGASNLTGWQLQKMLDYSKSMGLERFVSLQAQYSLLSRESEFELTDVCREEKVGFLPWSPLKGGWLSGKMQRGMSGAPEGSRIEWVTKSGGASQSHPGWDTFAGSEKTWKLLDAMNEIAQSHKKTVAQVAINWLLKDPLISSVVIGAKTMAQLEDNMGAGTGWTISDEEKAQLDELSAVPIPYPYEMIWRVNANRK